MSERFSREELERGFAHYCRINDEASASRDWSRLPHPTDPSAEPFQFPTWTLLKYAGDLLFRYEEDNYNPREATETIQAWREAGGRMLTREQVSMK